MNWKNMPVSMQNRLITVTAIRRYQNVLQISENFWEKTAVESYFSKVKGLHSTILSKKDPATGVFVKPFQNFQNSYFLDGCF